MINSTRNKTNSFETLFRVPKGKLSRVSDISSNFSKRKSKHSTNSDFSKTNLEHSDSSDHLLPNKSSEKLFKPVISPRQPSFSQLFKITESNLVKNNSLTSRSKHSKTTVQLFKDMPISPVKNQESPRFLCEKIRFPLPGFQVAKYFQHRLTHFEKNEVLKYKEVYYLGGSVSIEKDLTNLDDEKGFYIVKNKDHIAYRYEILELLGRGSFGKVYRVKDHKKQTEQALKIISSQPFFQKQALTEIKILKFLKKHDVSESNSIVQIKDCFSFRNHVCISFELLSLSLYDFLKNNSFKGLSSFLIRSFSSQILKALCLLDAVKIIHCDLKPENILLKSQNQTVVKLIDFGCSCFTQERRFGYIQSRFYRAPEVILGVSYNSAIDIWSFGCILAELHTGKPLFPGRNEADQLMRIVELIGSPPEDFLNRAPRAFQFWTGGVWRGKGEVEVRKALSKSIESVLEGAEEAFVELVRSCLKWNPCDRITPKKALAHLWINQRLGKISEEMSPKHFKTESQAGKATSRIRSHRNSLQVYFNNF